MPVREGWFDSETFDRNREKFTLEDLRPYWGRHVAWSLDGTRILADGATFNECEQRLRELGIDPCSTLASFIHDPDVSYI